MPRSKKPRNKPYRPRPVDPMHGYMKLTRCAVSSISMTEEDAGELEVVVLTALEEMRKGTGTPNEWNSVARGINHAWTLAKNGIGEQALPAIDDAEAAMRRAEKRYYDTGRLLLDGDGLRAVRLALDLWGQQLRLSTVGEVDAATRAVERKYWEKQA